jgi:hypothetical protein
LASSKCPLCRERKAKRPCPAKAETICAPCCGSKRRVEIDCPDDCVYLTGEHAAGWEGRETERRRDMKRVAPFVGTLSEVQSRLFFLTLVGLVGLRARRRDLDDALLAQAVVALRKTVETRAHGVLYDHQAEDARAQGLVVELRELFSAKDEDGRALAPDDRDLLAMLGALEHALAFTMHEQAGGVAFLDTATRLVGRMRGRMEAGPDAPRKPLIVEP